MGAAELVVPAALSEPASEGTGLATGADGRGEGGTGACTCGSEGTDGSGASTRTPGTVTGGVDTGGVETCGSGAGRATGGTETDGTRTGGTSRSCADTVAGAAPATTKTAIETLNAPCMRT